MCGFRFSVHTTLSNHLDFRDAYVNPAIKSNPQQAWAAAYIEAELPPNL
jgi:hypothetical protein